MGIPDSRVWRNERPGVTLGIIAASRKASARSCDCCWQKSFMKIPSMFYGRASQVMSRTRKAARTQVRYTFAEAMGDSANGAHEIGHGGREWAGSAERPEDPRRLRNRSELDAS